MNTITRLSFTILAVCFPHLAYSGPCYTDTGSCDTEGQIIIVKPKKEGNGFCTEYINDKNEKATRCYYQPVVKTQSDKDNKVTYNNTPTRSQPATGINFIYNTPANPINYGYPYSSYRNYNDETPNYFYRYNDDYYYGDYYHRPHRPPRPKPNPEVNQGPSGRTITKGGGHKNIIREPVGKQYPTHNSRPNFSGGHSSGGNRGFNSGGNRGSSSSHSSGGGRVKVID